MKRFTLTFLFFLTINFLFAAYSYAESSASIENLSSDNVDFTTDDILELKLVSDQIDNNQIDLTALNKDFEIINQSKQVYHSIINGKASSKIQWIISLRAKNTGKITIPKLKFGNEYTKPIEIIIKEPYVDPNKAQEIFIIAEAGNQEAYVNSPLNIDVKIYVSTDITVRNLNLTSPDNENYSIFKLSDSKKRAFYKNRRYDVFNVNYLVFYKNKGTLEIPKFQLSGHKLNNNKTHDIFSLYQQQWQPFHRENASIPINILPLPLQTDLVADNITVSQEWSNTNQSLEEGDALQRTITITGTNILAEQLPSLFDQDDLSNTPAFKHYVDKPERSNNIINNKLISKLIQKITYIPTSSGKMVLPGKTISWWDHKEQKLNSSTLEGKEYNIISILNNNEENTNNLIIADNKQNITTKTTDKNNEILSNSSNNQNIVIYLLFSIIIILITLIILLVIKIYKNNNLSFKQEKKILGNLAHNNNDATKLINNHIKDLINNAQAKNANLTYKSLNNITNILYPNDSNSIYTFKNNLQQDEKPVLEQLLETLYSGNNLKNPDWNHKKFLEIILPVIKEMAKNLQHKNSEISKNSKLPELYPN